MTYINDMFNEGFRSHADAVARAGGLSKDFEQGAVKSIRRRRGIRAAGVGAGSVLAIGAVGVAVWATPALRGGASVTPAALTASAAQCDGPQFLGPNPDSLGDAPFAFRVYVQVAGGAPSRIVVVHKDGTGGDVLPDANGDWVYTYAGQDFTLARADDASAQWATGLVVDYSTDGTGAGVSWDGRSNVDESYAWTTRVPASVPEGVDTVLLSSTLMTAIGLGGVGMHPGAVPAGAVVSAVIVDADGERTTQLSAGDPMPDIDGVDDTGQAETPVEGLESVAIRVTNLPGDETFVIESTYDPSVLPVVGCLRPASGSSQAATPTADPWEGPPPSMAPDQPGDTSGASSSPGPDSSELPILGSSPSKVPLVSPSSS